MEPAPLESGRSSLFRYLPSCRLDTLRKIEGVKKRKGDVSPTVPLPHNSDLSVRFHELFSVRIDRWSDNGIGKCWLEETRISKRVADSLESFDSDRYELGEWVVMPNHVHLIVAPKPGFELAKILHSWKSYTANSTNTEIHRSGKL